jgi:hypothetical protein
VNDTATSSSSAATSSLSSVQDSPTTKLAPQPQPSPSPQIIVPKDDPHDEDEDTEGTVAPRSTVTPTQSPPTTNNNKFIKYYSYAKTDRAGAQIIDMLAMEAVVYNKMKQESTTSGITRVYAGACTKSITTKKDQYNFNLRLPDKNALLQLLGLEHVLPWACPTEKELATGEAQMMEPLSFHELNETFSMDWVHHIRNLSTVPRRNNNNAPKGQDDKEMPKQIAVHMRRGDYSPCRNSAKYLPNTYYLDVLDEYLPQYCPTSDACNVTIFTEEEAYEDFEPFKERNYHLDLNSSVDQIWAAMINADLLILSKSSFSWVPGIMNMNKVVTPQYKFPVCDNWDVASSDITSKSDQVVNDFVNHQCNQ